MHSISFVGKILSLIMVVLMLFFSYITAVNSSSLLSKQLLQAQNMQSTLKSQYNEAITDSGNYTSQSNVLNSQKGKMVPINRDSNDFANLETLQDTHSQNQSKNNPNNGSSSKSVIVK